MSECVLKTLACRGLRVGPSEFGRRPPRVTFESLLGIFRISFGLLRALGGATDHNSSGNLGFCPDD